MNKLSKYLYIVEVVAFPLLAVSSWFTRIYGISERCLIDVQGARWVMTTFVSNLSRLPIAEAIFVLIVLGTFVESGLLQSLLSRRHTIRQVRALSFAAIAFIMLVGVVIEMTFKANSVLLSVFGGIQSSPLLIAAPGIVLFTLLAVSVVYGFASGKFVTFGDLMSSHTVYLKRFAPCVIHFYLLGQLWFWFCYSYVD